MGEQVTRHLRSTGQAVELGGPDPVEHLRNPGNLRTAALRLFEVALCCGGDIRSAMGTRRLMRPDELVAGAAQFKLQRQGRQSARPASRWTWTPAGSRSGKGGASATPGMSSRTRANSPQAKLSGSASRILTTRSRSPWRARSRHGNGSKDCCRACRAATPMSRCSRPNIRRRNSRSGDRPTSRRPTQPAELHLLGLTPDILGARCAHVSGGVIGGGQRRAALERSIGLDADHSLPGGAAAHQPCPGPGRATNARKAQNSRCVPARMHPAPHAFDVQPLVST